MNDSAFWLQVVLLPAALLVVGMYARRLGRRDGDDSFRRNDWAVNTTILLMMFGKTATELVRIMTTPNATPVAGNVNPGGNAMIWFLAVIAVLVASLDYDRTRSWERDKDGAPTHKKKLWGGIVFPVAVAIITFAFYQYDQMP